MAVMGLFRSSFMEASLRCGGRAVTYDGLLVAGLDLSSALWIIADIFGDVLSAPGICAL